MRSLRPLLAVLFVAPSTAACGGDDVPSEAPPTAPPAAEAAAPYTASERVAIARHPGDPRVETWSAGRFLGMSGRLSRVDAQSTTPLAAAWEFTRALGTAALGWAHPDDDLAELSREYASIPVRFATGDGAIEVHAVTLAQLHRALPIEGREATVLVGRHWGEAGFVVGGWFGALGAEPPGSGSTPSPSVGEAVAWRNAVSDARTRTLGIAFGQHKARLVWIERDGALVLAWRILARGGRLGERARFLVDATNGGVLDVDEVRRADWWSAKDAVSGPASAWAPPSPRTIEFLYDAGRYGVVAHHASGVKGIVALWQWKSYSPETGHVYDAVSRSAPTLIDPDWQPIRFGTDAFLHARSVLDLYRSKLGWKSWDGRDGDLLLEPYVDANDFNAYGGGGSISMPSGVGGAFDKPAGASLDVVGHELLHSVSDATVQLDYDGESGALEEALADLSGQFAKSWSSDWVGEGSTPSGGDGLRNMRDPTLRGQPDHLAGYVQTNDDHHGVHTNSGIVNKAHALMVRGTNLPFHGWQVAPVAESPSIAVDRVMALEMSALMLGAYASTTSLTAYGVTLNGYCRVQNVLWALVGSPTRIDCGPVHDALAATGLLPASNAPTDLRPVTLGVAAAGAGTTAGWSQLYFAMKNEGTARFEGTMHVRVRSASGAWLLGKADLNGVVQPRSTLGEGSVPFDPSPLLSELPDATAVLEASIDDPSLDGDATNDRVTFTVSGTAWPAGTLADVLSDGGLSLRLVRAGSYPLASGDVSARFVYRASDAGAFTYAPSPPMLRRNPKTILAGVDGAPVENLFQLVPDPWRQVPVHVVRGSPVLADGTKYGRVILGSDGVLRDAWANELRGPLLFAAVNVDRKFQVKPGAPFLFCLNCAPDVAGARAFSVVYFEPRAQASWFPPELEPLVRDLVPIPKDLVIPRYAKPGFQRWIALPEIDPRPWAAPIDAINLGP